MYKLRFGLCSSKYNTMNTPEPVAETGADRAGSPVLSACAALGLVTEGVWEPRRIFQGSCHTESEEE